MSEVDELYEALEEAREADQVASACVLYEEILTREEVENVFSTLLYVTDLIDFGNYLQAEATLNRLEDMCDTDDARELHCFNRATLHEKRGELAEAEKWYRKAHEWNTSRGELLLMAAEMAFHRGEVGRAEFLVREALKYQCDKAEAFGTLGGYLASQRRFEEARRMFGEVLSLDPGNGHAREWLLDLEPLV